MSLHLFIDTNIYLTFFHFSDEDIEELKKLVVLVREKRITLYVTEQLHNEFYRNREERIADAVAKLKEHKLKPQFPKLSESYAELEEIKKAVRNYEIYKNRLIENIESDSLSYSLKADSIITELFAHAHFIPYNEAVTALAALRMTIGNPPKKGSSHGDALNWEMLLESVPDHEEFFLISADGDYSSVLQKDRLKDFLIGEWEKKKSSSIYFYKKLSTFFKEKYPGIQLSSDLEKDLSIQRLALAASFEMSKTVLQQLSAFESFNEDQINKIIEAAISNTQIHWIKDDPGVGDFLSSLVVEYEGIIDTDLLEEFYKIYEPEVYEESMEIKLKE